MINTLFPNDMVVGIFRGFSEGGIEFHAELTLPYQTDFQCRPMHGHFLLVQLESDQEAVLGRISSISSQGRLSTSVGDEYNIRAIRANRPVAEDIRDEYLRYKIDMRVLGVIKAREGKLVFAATHRRLPHVGSKVAFPTNQILESLVGHDREGAELGFLALGEFIYSGSDKRVGEESWMQIMQPTIIPKFNVQHLVSRRSFVFARAGFGKSNLVKNLFSELYKETPTVEKRGEKRAPVGTLIFDPDGEYFWPDDKGRPGLCDVISLEKRLVVFTSRKAPSPFYQSFVACGIKLDIRRLRPSDVIGIALAPEKQDQQNVRKLKGLSDRAWQELVDIIHESGNSTDQNSIAAILRLDEGQESEIFAARANMTAIVRMLHEPSSQMMDILFSALSQGCVCIIDVSQMRGTPALILSGLILSKIFDHNQEQFTQENPKTIPTIAVIEEAQSILNNPNSSGSAPFISWVKEGRKYDLGSLMITQQPGSIPNELLSQGDNWFVFHLLSHGDLQSVKSANAHFSSDILQSLLNEPVPGHGVYWSSATGRPYPIPFRAMLFQQQHQCRDPKYNRTKVETAASNLNSLAEAQAANISTDTHEGEPTKIDTSVEPPPSQNDTFTAPRDYLRDLESSVISTIKKNHTLIDRTRQEGQPWMAFIQEIKKAMPPTLHDADRRAASMVSKVLDSIFGVDKWSTVKKPAKSGQKLTLYVKVDE